MNIYDTRQKRVRDLIAQRYDGKQKLFADAIERDANYVSRMLSNGNHRKNIAEELARAIEKQLNLKTGWLDGDETARAPLPTVHGYPISEDAARLAAEWEKLEEPARSQIQTMIESLVAAQVRKKRGKKAARPAAGITVVSQ